MIKQVVINNKEIEAFKYISTPKLSKDKKTVTFGTVKDGQHLIYSINLASDK